MTKPKRKPRPYTSQSPYKEFNLKPPTCQGKATPATGGNARLVVSAGYTPGHRTGKG